MAQTLEALIEKEFQDVQKTREDLLAKKQEIDNQLRALDLRLQAAVNYRATLEGKFAQPVTRSRKQQTKTGTRAPRGARAGRGSCRSSRGDRPYRRGCRSRRRLA